MERIANDNALLEACDQLHRNTIVAAIALFVAVGGIWFLCVAIPAGAL